MPVALGKEIHPHWQMNKLNEWELTVFLHWKEITGLVEVRLIAGPDRERLTQPGLFCGRALVVYPDSLSTTPSPFTYYPCLFKSTAIWPHMGLAFILWLKMKRERCSMALLDVGREGNRGTSRTSSKTFTSSGDQWSELLLWQDSATWLYAP